MKKKLIIILTICITFTLFSGCNTNNNGNQISEVVLASDSPDFVADELSYEDFTKYISTDKFFQLMYPNNLTLFEKNQVIDNDDEIEKMENFTQLDKSTIKKMFDTNDTLWFSKDEKSNKLEASMEVDITNSNGINKEKLMEIETQNAFKNQILSALKIIDDNPTFINLQSGNIGSNYFISYATGYNDNNIDLVCLQAVTSINDNLYTITYTTTKDKKEEADKTFNLILSSFNLNN